MATPEWTPAVLWVYTLYGYSLRGLWGGLTFPVSPPHRPLKLYPYKVYTHNTAGAHSGVAILIRPEIKHFKINEDFYGDTLAIQVETFLGPIVLACNYTPPSRLHLPLGDLIWMERLFRPVYCIADLNAHHTSYDRSTNDYGRILYNRFLSIGSLQRVGPDIGTFISPGGLRSKPDIVLINGQCNHHHFVTTLDKNISDHAPIQVLINLILY